jgi:hypothetical protein
MSYHGVYIVFNPLMKGYNSFSNSCSRFSSKIGKPKWESTLVFRDWENVLAA